MNARAWVVLLATPLVACTSEVTSPMGRPLPLSPATVLPSGHSAVAGEVAIRASSAQPALDAWTVAARHGFGDGLEGTLDASYLNDLGDFRTPATSSGVTMRAGVRHQTSRRLVLFGALTGGAWDKGALMAGDVGLTVGTEFVFFTARLSVSGTIGGKVVDDGSYELFCFLCTSHVDQRNAPHTAGALETMVGFRLPLTVQRSLWLALGVEIVQSVTAVEYHLGAGIGTGLEAVF